MAFTSDELVDKAIDQRRRGRFEEALISLLARLKFTLKVYLPSNFTF
jgi:hypothetical protein